MLTMNYASSLIRAQGGPVRIDPRELELLYSGPRHGLKDVTRLAAAISGVALYAGLLAAAWQ